MKLTSATRSGATIRVAGTLARGASGRVTLVWTQKLGRTMLTQRTTARIVRGRFSATIRLPRELAGSRAAGRLTVSYGGDADTAGARVTRTVKAGRGR